MTHPDHPDKPDHETVTLQVTTESGKTGTLTFEINPSGHAKVTFEADEPETPPEEPAT